MWSLRLMGVEAAKVTSWPRPLDDGRSARINCIGRKEGSEGEGDGRGVWRRDRSDNDIHRWSI